MLISTTAIEGFLLRCVCLVVAIRELWCWFVFIILVFSAGRLRAFVCKDYYVVSKYFTASLTVVPSSPPVLSDSSRTTIVL